MVIMAKAQEEIAQWEQKLEEQKKQAKIDEELKAQQAQQAQTAFPKINIQQPPNGMAPAMGNMGKAGAWKGGGKQGFNQMNMNSKGMPKAAMGKGGKGSNVDPMQFMETLASFASMMSNM